MRTQHRPTRAVRKAPKSKLRTFVTFLQVLVLIGISASVGVALGLFVTLSSMLEKAEGMKDIEAPEATIVYSSDGVVLGRIFREDRTNVKLDDVPTELINATVAIEDSRFYQHSGVDLRGVARAVYKNLRGHRMAQGGSTITQQLARNVYLTQRKTVERKIQEAVLAILIERNFSKEKILELYLNRVYYGSGAFGVQAAARTYLGKSVDQLSLSESAMLAGLPRRPSDWSPYEDKEAALNRRDVVLNRMAQLGYISKSDADDAKKENIRIVPKLRGRTIYKASHFIDYVIKQLRSKFTDEVIFNGGLRIYTTLNYEMQQAAEKALRNGVRKYESSRRVSEGCFIALDPTNGYIVSMVGSVNPSSQFNRTVQGNGRQPGSTFKLFVYTAAIAELGLRPSDRVQDSPVSYPGSGGKDWKPRNYDDRFRGWVSIRTAVAQSINIPAIKTAEKVGIEKVVKYAEMMGIKSELEPYLPAAIGGVKGVHPLEMAAAYGTVANDGEYVEPCSVIRIQNAHGETIQDYKPTSRKVLSKKVVETMDGLLRYVVTHGTGSKAGVIHDARGKTGTTNSDRDAWFIGYVPKKLVAACWVGNDDNSPMRSAFGGKVCAPIWSQFMQKSIPVLNAVREKRKRLAEGLPAVPKPEVPVTKPKAPAQPPVETDVSIPEKTDTTSVEICNDSGLKANAKCTSTHWEKFDRSAIPQVCDLHSDTAVTSDPSKPNEDMSTAEVNVCADSGMLAGPSCPNKRKKRMPIDEVPTQVCNIHGGRP